MKSNIIYRITDDTEWVSKFILVNANFAESNITENVAEPMQSEIQLFTNKKS